MNSCCLLMRKLWLLFLVRWEEGYRWIMGVLFVGIIIFDLEDGFYLWYGKCLVWLGVGYGGIFVCEGVMG